MSNFVNFLSGPGAMLVNLPEDFASLDLKVLAFRLVAKFMSRVTKKNIPPLVAQNCDQPIYCLKQDVRDFEDFHVILTTRKSSGLPCNEFHSL